MAEALPTVIDLESDRMRSLAVAPKLLASERQVVLEERRLRVDNDQLGLMDEELGALMFKAHAYRWPVIGWQRDIEAITREDCLHYFRTFYAPNNATLYVAGDFEPRDTLQRIKKAYGSIKPGPTAAPVLDAEPTQRGERRAQVLYPAQAPALMVSWRAPRSTERDTLVLDVLQFILSAGQSSRLTKALIFEQEVAVSCGVDFSWRLDPAAFTVTMELKPGGDVQAAEAALTAQLEAVVSKGVTAREVEKATNNLAASMLRELATNNGRAHSMGTWEAMLGDWRTGLNLADAYRSVTPAQVQRAAAQYLKPELRNVVTLVPSQTAEVAA
jgi:predicted Zn-dependent peptidase